MRNLQLLPVTYPGWTLKVYTDPMFITSNHSNRSSNENARYSNISDRIIRTLQALGAKVVFEKPENIRNIPPQLWSYLVADELEVEYFLIRHADKRLSRLEKALVNQWLDSEPPKSVLGIKDHPMHANFTLIDGLWGARSKSLRSLLTGTSMQNLLQQYEMKANNTPATFLELIYTRVQNDIVLYDSIACDKPHSVPFPIARNGYEYIGQSYDAHERTSTEDKYAVLSARNLRCEGEF